MKTLLVGLLVSVLITSTFAFAHASGGKVNNPWQPVDPATVFIPAGFSEETCEEIASTTSGQTYLCEEFEDKDD